MSDKILVTKMDRAIYETKLQLNNTKEQIMLLSKQRDVLQEQLDMLELVQQNKSYM